MKLKEILLENTSFKVDFSGESLVNEDLTCTNLKGANLRNADLTGAKLQRADLRGADLSYSSLMGANLEDADLTGANLSEVKLCGACLINTKGIATFSFGKHMALAYKWNRTVYIIIGCITLSRAEWAKHYKRIGKRQEYTKEEISAYGAFIKLAGGLK